MITPFSLFSFLNFFLNLRYDNKEHVAYANIYNMFEGKNVSIQKCKNNLS